MFQTKNRQALRQTAPVFEPRNLNETLQNGRMKIFEINPRFSATCPLRSYAGINEPDIVFRNAVFDEKIEKLAIVGDWSV